MSDVCMRPIATWSVCLSVMHLHCAETAKQIEILHRIDSWRQRRVVLDGRQEGAAVGQFGSLYSVHK